MSTLGRAAVTGATGFLGGALVKRLRPEQEVAVLVRPGRPANHRRRPRR